MEIHEIKKTTCIVFMFGFLAGIIYLNICAKAYMISMGIFSDYFLEQYACDKLNTGEYIWYIIKIRLISVVILAVFSNTKYRRIIAIIFLVWTGFSSGLILTTSILKLGAKGIGLCVVGVVPHFICYITIYVILIVYMFTYPGSKWNSTKTITIIIFFLLGIITEAYINPVLIDAIIHIM